MFTILLKKVNGNAYQRYFKSFDSAKKVMDEEVSRWISEGAEPLMKIDRMNIEKGFYEYEANLKLIEDGKTYNVSFALLDGYFQDED